MGSVRQGWRRRQQGRRQRSEVLAPVRRRQGSLGAELHSPLTQDVNPSARSLRQSPTALSRPNTIEETGNQDAIASHQGWEDSRGHSGMDIRESCVYSCPVAGPCEEASSMVFDSVISYRKSFSHKEVINSKGPFPVKSCGCSNLEDCTENRVSWRDTKPVTLLNRNVVYSNKSNDENRKLSCCPLTYPLPFTVFFAGLPCWPLFNSSGQNSCNINRIKHNTTNCLIPSNFSRALRTKRENTTLISGRDMADTRGDTRSRVTAGGGAAITNYKGLQMLIIAMIVLAAMGGRTCDAYPTPPPPTSPTSTHPHTPNYAHEPPRRELRLCCDGPESTGPTRNVRVAGLRPANVTVLRRSATSVLVTWSRPFVQPLKYEITYKPTNAKYRVVAEVTAPQRSVVLERLLPLTQYQVFVTSVINSTALHTSPTVIFQTATHSAPGNDTGWVISTPAVLEEMGSTEGGMGRGIGVDKAGLVRVRAEEVGIVLLVLAVWMFAIVLFFNRWGKIRMLEPYQEPYKEAPPNQLLQHRPSCPMADPCALPISAGKVEPPTESAPLTPRSLSPSNSIHINVEKV